MNPKKYKFCRDNGLCTRCQKPNPTPEFSGCADCRSQMNAAQKQRYLSDTRKHIDAGIARRRKLKEEVIQAYGGQCVCCREDYLPYLELDHVYGGGNKHRQEVPHWNLLRLLKNENFPSYIQLLCGNCHNAKSRGVPCKVHGE